MTVLVGVVIGYLLGASAGRPGQAGGGPGAATAARQDDGGDVVSDVRSQAGTMLRSLAALVEGSGHGDPGADADLVARVRSLVEMK